MTSTIIIVSVAIVVVGIGVGLFFILKKKATPVKPQDAQATSLKITIGKVTEKP
jgi:hypothetical protein